jgi:hypothetical protein
MTSKTRGLIAFIYSSTPEQAFIGMRADFSISRSEKLVSNALYSSQLRMFETKYLGSRITGTREDERVELSPTLSDL